MISLFLFAEAYSLERVYEGQTIALEPLVVKNTRASWIFRSGEGKPIVEMARSCVCNSRALDARRSLHHTFFPEMTCSEQVFKPNSVPLSGRPEDLSPLVPPVLGQEKGSPALL